MQEKYDYIIVGAGSAGCLLANRLSANPNNSVLLIEAGRKDNNLWLHVPVGYFKTMNNPKFDWMYQLEKDKGLIIEGLTGQEEKFLEDQAHLMDFFIFEEIGMTMTTGKS